MSPAALVLLLATPASDAPDLGVESTCLAVPPGDPAELSDVPRPVAVKHGVIFVNFEGAQIGSCCDEDSRQNSSAIAGQYGLLGNYPAYGGNESDQSAALQAVAEDFAAFDITVTDARPASGDYTMVMIGPASIGSGALGVAPMDCQDARSQTTSPSRSTARATARPPHTMPPRSARKPRTPSASTTPPTATTPCTRRHRPTPRSWIHAPP